MDIEEYDKYHLEEDSEEVKKLPLILSKSLYLVRDKDYSKDCWLYLNENGVEKKIAYRDGGGFYYEILLQLLLEPLTNYEEFKALVDRGNEEIKPKILANLWGYGTEEYNKRLGHPAVLFGKNFFFINSIDDLEKGKSYVNMNGTLVDWDDRHYHRDFIYCDKENGIYEIWFYGVEDKGGPEYFDLRIRFFEEKYLYEFLLNETLDAVIP